MELVVVGAAIVAFLVGFHLSGVVPAARHAIATAHAATTVLRNPLLPDDDKEVAVRKAGVSLLGSAVSILVRGLGAVLVALVPVVLADLLGLAESDAALALLLRWEVILATSAVLAVVWLVVASA